MQGRSVRLFLIDGAPTGLLTAEIVNWTGHIFVTPRSRLGDALNREEARRTGVYFLVGDDPVQASKNRVYVGEGDDIGERIKAHAKDSSKDFWTRVCMVTSKDTNLTKAHVRYLEGQFVEIITENGRANLENSNMPRLKSLPESDIADMKFFIEQVQLVLPVVGFDFLRPSFTSLNNSPEALSDVPRLVLESDKYGFSAEAIETPGGVTVFKGSRALAKGDFAHNGYSTLRDQLIKDGLLVPSNDPKFLVFSEDVQFSSPSAAAAVVRDRTTNGRTSWKVKGTGETLREWQDAQLEGAGN